MGKTITTFSFALVTWLATTSLAQAQLTGSNHAPLCFAKTVVINPLPEDLELGAFSINPITSKQACTDQDGDKLTITAVSKPATIDRDGIHFEAPPPPGQSLTVTFSVSDGKGGMEKSTLTVIRK